MTRLADLKAAFPRDPDHRAAHAALALEYGLARKLVAAARAAAGLSQTEVAECMGTQQSEVSRIEGAR
ncbi:MAG: hypothetical protein OXF07_15020 [Rhodobacter sp.]|nr:hypothetical protein [Rhodobacter sp.]MCY4243292.1 hypothetical protein [Rhodobacter sp.]